MGKFSIVKRPLRDSEAGILTKELRNFPDVGYIKQDRWNDMFPIIYVATENNAVVGICAAVPLKTWVKIGPLVVRKKYQGKSYGKLLFTHAVKQFQYLYVGSSNPIIWKLAKKEKFYTETNFWKLPREIKIYLIRYILERLSLSFIIDALRKKMTKRTYLYFLRYG